MRNIRGFTLIELTIGLLALGNLAAIAVPRFIAMQDRAREGMVKSNMHTLQIAVEEFAAENDDTYPISGSSDASVVALLPGGVSPENPFTGAACTITWGAAAAAQGDLGYDDPGENQYDITGFGARQLLPFVIRNY